MLALFGTLAICDDETTLESISVVNSEQSTTEASSITTYSTTKDASTVKSSITKLPRLLPSGTEERESEDCDEQLVIYEDRIADLEDKLKTYANQKKALKSVMKIVLGLLMNEVSLGTEEDDLDIKS